jgi:hypothetical protein
MEGRRNNGGAPRDITDTSGIFGLYEHLLVGFVVGIAPCKESEDEGVPIREGTEKGSSAVSMTT